MKKTSGTIVAAVDPTTRLKSCGSGAGSWAFVVATGDCCVDAACLLLENVSVVGWPSEPVDVHPNNVAL